MGPILPQVSVFGRELGVSPDVMGFITSFLPILYLIAKPAVGFLIDYFPVAISTLSFTLMININSIDEMMFFPFYLAHTEY